MMPVVVIGAAGFCALAVYDLLQLGRVPRTAVRLSGLAGYGCIAAAVLLAFRSAPLQPLPGPLSIMLSAVSILMLALLVYSVLLEIPLRSLRGPGGSRGGARERRAYRSGTYRLCRHPGVLWFTLMLAPQVPFRPAEFGFAAAALTVMDLALVAFEDRVVFPRLFTDYREYRVEVPFLFPRIGLRSRSTAGSRSGKRAGGI